MVKTALADIEQVKVEMKKAQEQLFQLSLKLLHDSRQLVKHINICSELNLIQFRLLESPDRDVINTIENQLQFLPTVSKLHSDLELLKARDPSLVGDKIISDWNCFKTSLIRKNISISEMEDLRIWLKRFQVVLLVKELRLNMATVNATIVLVPNETLKEVDAILQDSNATYDQLDTLYARLLPLLARPPTRKERNLIVKAIGLGSGHWFKCPLGHYYAIGECGGAMQTSKCIECGSIVGGERYRLVQDNAHAPEMDNSRAPAWSEINNLANFDP